MNQPRLRGFLDDGVINHLMAVRNVSIMSGDGAQAVDYKQRSDDME